MTHAEFDLSELLDALRAGDLSDPIRASLQWVLQALIEAEATEAIGAGPHERSASRINRRNGHRLRVLSTQAGDVELKIPKLRHGSFFPSLLERRRRIDRALFAVVMEAWVHGVSTRARSDDLVATYVKGRVNGRVVSRAVVVATGVTAIGDREVLGIEVGDSESERLGPRSSQDCGLGASTA